MRGEINVAVIGCGYWGPNLVRNFRSIPECRVQAVCDRDSRRLEHMCSLYSDLDTVKEAETLFDRSDIDAVCISTPAPTHYDLARRALQAGKHVLVEKPLALSSAHCRELIETAENKGLVLMVGHTFLYSAPVRYLKHLVVSGELGDVLYINCQRLNLGLFQREINVTWDLAPHDLSIILFLLGQSPVLVSCSGKWHVTPGVADVTSMSLDFPGHAFATVQSSWLDPNKTRLITVVGSKKMVVYDDTAPSEKIRVYDKRVEVPPHYDSYAEFHFSYHYGDMYCPRLELVEPLRAECRHFVESILTGSRPISDGRNGLEVVSILEAAEQSLAAKGAPVSLEQAVAATS